MRSNAAKIAVAVATNKTARGQVGRSRAASHGTGSTPRRPATGAPARSRGRAARRGVGGAQSYGERRARGARARDEPRSATVPAGARHVGYRRFRAHRGDAQRPRRVRLDDNERDRGFRRGLVPGVRHRHGRAGRRSRVRSSQRCARGPCREWHRSTKCGCGTSATANRPRCCAPAAAAHRRAQRSHHRGHGADRQPGSSTATTPAVAWRSSGRSVSVMTSSTRRLRPDGRGRHV